MKKIISLVLTCSSILLLSACSLFGPSDNLTSITGVLTEQEDGDNYSGTHLITDEDGDIYPVNSTVINLSSQQYIGNRVTVRGENNSDNVFTVNGVSVLEVLEKPTGKANWTTYLSQYYGFKTKYYDNWKVGTGADASVEFVSPSSSVMTVMYFKNDENKPLTDFVLDKTALMSDAKIGIDKSEAKKIEFSDGSLAYFVSRPGFVYEVSFTPEGGSSDEDKRTFLEMLQEFQFIPFSNDSPAVTITVDTANQPTTEDPAGTSETTSVTDVTDVPVEVPSVDYSDFDPLESLPYHFTAKYPNGWYYAGFSKPSADVLHSYVFSDEEVSATNGFASLNVMASTELKEGTYKVYNGDQVSISVKVGDRVYQVKGKKELEDVLIKIAASITPSVSE